MKKKIEARVIADSKNEHGQRITTYVLTYPRFIHAECKTHRVLSDDDSYYEDTSLMNEKMFSRNAASSRAIPTSRMIKDIEEDPFIPVAWQKAHKGMQGIEYFDHTKEVGSKDVLSKIKREWLKARDEAVHRAKGMLDLGITKQLINRILEPYQWYTCIVTATEYDNFFELRCPEYQWDGQSFKGRKDCLDFVNSNSPVHSSMNTWDDLSWLKLNKGQGEIHISLLAEAMWDAMNESTPKQLKAGEWHIPFSDNINIYRYWRESSEDSMEILKVKIATARCARVSYLNFEGKDDYESDINLYDILKDSGHYSPFEHCARAMSKDELQQWGKCEPQVRKDGTPYPYLREYQEGWSGNLRGFVQLRKDIEND